MMTGVPFTKYQATGNDFILIDARDPDLRRKIQSFTRADIAKICDRRFGVGGDGLLLLLSHPEYDFEMRNFNSDGGECTMCGNGGRSLVKFARQLGINKDHYRFIAADGIHEAKIEGNLVHLKMKDVAPGIPTPHGITFQTGSPHLVCKVKDLMNIDVVHEGRKIRNSPQFMPAGINVNFVEEVDGDLFIRTYERGVEDETLSCGTGVIAAALAFNKSIIQARGGMLKVSFEKIVEKTAEKTGDTYQNIWLTGATEKTFEGSL